MAEIERVTEHPFKRRLADIPVDRSLTEEGGWSGMAVQWIVTAETPNRVASSATRARPCSSTSRAM